PPRSPPLPYTTLFRSAPCWPCESAYWALRSAVPLLGVHRDEPPDAPACLGRSSTVTSPSTAAGSARRRNDSTIRYGLVSVRMSRSEEHTSELQSRENL